MPSISEFSYPCNTARRCHRAGEDQRTRMERQGRAFSGRLLMYKSEERVGIFLSSLRGLDCEMERASSFSSGPRCFRVVSDEK